MGAGIDMGEGIDRRNGEGNLLFKIMLLWTVLILRTFQSVPPITCFQKQQIANNFREFD